MIILKKISVEGFKEFFANLKDNLAYMIPVLLFIGFSISIVAAEKSMGVLFIFKVIFLIWSLYIAMQRKLVYWPLFLIIAFSFFLHAGVSLMFEFDMKNATEAFMVNENRKAKEILEKIESEDVIKSKHYQLLMENVNVRLKQEVDELIQKGRDEIKNNRLEEARQTISLIFEYDSENRIAAGMLKTVEDKYLLAGEKELSPETLAEVKTLRRKINTLIGQRKFADANSALNEFISENQELSGTNIVIRDLINKIDESEKAFNFNKERQQNSARINEAAKLIKEGDYKKSIILLEEALTYDKNNRTAKRLLDRAGKNLKEEKDKILFKVYSALFIIIIILIIWFIYSYYRKCPNCRKYSARELMRQEEISRRFSYRWGFDDEQIPTLIRSIANHYKCRFCSYQWTGISIKETDA